MGKYISQLAEKFRSLIAKPDCPDDQRAAIQRMLEELEGDAPPPSEKKQARATAAAASTLESCVAFARQTLRRPGLSPEARAAAVDILRSAGLTGEAEMHALTADQMKGLSAMRAAHSDPNGHIQHTQDQLRAIRGK
jgi:hypothetical protein